MGIYDWNNREVGIGLLDHASQVRFALHCVNMVSGIDAYQTSKACLVVADRYLAGKASAEECGKAFSYACEAARTMRDLHCHTSIYAVCEAASHVVACAGEGRANHISQKMASTAISLALETVSLAESKSLLKCSMMQYLWELLHVDDIVKSSLLG